MKQEPDNREYTKTNNNMFEVRRYGSSVWAFLATLVVLILLAWLIISQVGCATRGYVRQQCREVRRQAREYTRNQKTDCLQYTAEVDERIDRIMSTPITRP